MGSRAVHLWVKGSGASLRVSSGRSWGRQHHRRLRHAGTVTTGRVWVCRATWLPSPTTEPHDGEGSYRFFPRSQMGAAQRSQGGRCNDPAVSQPAWASPEGECVGIWLSGTLLLDGGSRVLRRGTHVGHAHPGLLSLYSPPASQKCSVSCACY